MQHVMLFNRRKNYKEYRVVSLHVLYAWLINIHVYKHDVLLTFFNNAC